jgi:predicted PurR-regulated permease PerM
MSTSGTPLSDADRRRLDRRSGFVPLADYTVPELRKALVTMGALVLIAGLFIYMVSEVVVAVIAGVVAGMYLVPLQEFLERRTDGRRLSAILTIILFTVPLLAVLTYSWIEISGAAKYLSDHSSEVIAGLNRGLSRVPYVRDLDLADQLPYWVNTVASSSGQIVDQLRETIDVLLIGVSVFLFTTFYFLTDHDGIRRYVRDRTPGRYRSLVDPVTDHVKAVIYGVLYGTFLTQFMKSVIILVMNLIWDVPLAIVLAIASFFIGLLPVVGSWTVYTPVAGYLILWRGDLLGGFLMLAVGLVLNTIVISMYLRPKIAAEKSEVLNFYWMFIALVTGVYSFGLMGIIIGPVLIAVLKAILDTLITGDDAPLLVGPGRSTSPS